MGALGGENFRTYALDFWGFGESGKKRSTYTVADFVDLVDQFMDRLGIPAVPIVGHSMGGPVSVEAAKRLGDRVVGGAAAHQDDVAHRLELDDHRLHEHPAHAHDADRGLALLDLADLHPVPVADRHRHLERLVLAFALRNLG